MDFIKKFIYVYLLVLFFNKLFDFKTSSYNFCDSLHAGINFFKINTINTKDLMDNHQLIYKFILPIKIIFVVLSFFGIRICIFSMMIWVIYDSIFNIRNWNKWTLLFNIFVIVGLLIDLFTTQGMGWLWKLFTEVEDEKDQKKKERKARLGDIKDKINNVHNKKNN